MPRTRPPYPAAFRAEAIELARTSGKTIPELAADLGVSGQTLRNWLHQADVDAGHGRPGELTTTEREELRRLRRENQVLRQEREILKRPLPSSRRRRPGEPVSVHRGGEGSLSGQPAVPDPWRLPQGVLRLGRARPVRPPAHRPGTGRPDHQDPPRLARHLRRPQGPRRAARPRRAGGPQASGPADAHPRAGRLPPAPPPRADPPRPGRHPTPDLVGRLFDPGAPDRTWFADISYIPTGQGWLYLAAVLDGCSRRVVGWAMAEHLRAELAVDALRMALEWRQPAQGLICHSDRGSQYTAGVYAQALQAAGARQSMGRVATCFDNAACESFFATLKTELVHTRAWPTRQAARTAIYEYIEVFYNRRRRHSALDYLSPTEYERRHHQQQPATLVAA